MRRKTAIVAGVLALGALVAVVVPVVIQARASRLAAEQARLAAEAEAKARAEAKAQEEARAAAEARAKAEAEARAAEEARAREAAEARAREAEAAARAEAEARARELRERSLAAFHRGVQAQKAGDVPAAIAAYREALAIDAALAGAWTNLALALDAAGQHADALDAARRGVDAVPSGDGARRARALHVVGHVAARGGATADAVKAYQEALAADARHADAAIALAALLSEAGDVAGAEAVLRAADAAAAEVAGVDVALATVAWRTGDTTKARRHAEEALREDPASTEARLILGWCDLAARRWGDAAQRLEEAAKARPSDADLQAAIGYAYEKLGRHADAVAAYERAVAIAPEHPTAHAGRGASLEAMGDAQRAAEAYAAAAASGSPKAACAAKVRLAAIAYRERRFADARALAEQAVAADAADPAAHHALGLACFALGDRRCASDQEQWLLTVDPARSADLRALISRE